MKDLIITGLICFVTFSVFAQSSGTIPANDIIIGRNFVTNTDIKAKRYVFPDIIYQWSANDSTRMLAMQLRGTKDNGKEQKDNGNILLFDLLTEQIRWNQKIDYQQSTLDQYDNMLIKTTDNKSSCLSLENGENLWSTKNALSYVNSAKGIGVGYADRSTNTLEGIDLKTGKSIWKRKVSREYNLNDIFELNDSVIIISADGLNALNMKTGVGWNYDARTGKKDYSGTVATNVVGFTFSLLFGTDYDMVTGHDLITGVVSNTLTDSTGIYMADKESLVRLDQYGFIAWKSILPKKLVSRSSLFFKDSLVCMVNDGSAFLNSESTSYGKPFIAAYSKNTGKKVFLSRIGYKNEQILSYEIQRDTLLLLSKKKVFKYSLKDGNELWEQSIKTDSVGELTQFGGSTMYVRLDSASVKPIQSDSASFSVSSNKNQLLILNNDLKVTNIIPNDQIYYCYLEAKGYKFLDAGETTLVIDKNNKVVAELDISGSATLKGTKLFDVQGNNFVVIDIGQLIMN